MSLNKKTVLITGASSGIGAACAHAFAKAGANIILTARRLERLEKLGNELKEQYQIKYYCGECDIRDAKDVSMLIQNLPKNFNSIDILVNNAGVACGLSKLHDASFDDIDTMIDTNLKGLLYASREVIPAMVARNSGHVINIGSIAGHEPYPNGAIYCATKAAVKQLTKALKMDLLGTQVRVSSVDPGMVETEFSVHRLGGDSARAKKVYENMTPLSPDDIADAVLYCATRPPHVNVSEMIVLATDQSSATMVHRK